MTEREKMRAGFVNLVEMLYAGMSGMQNNPDMEKAHEVSRIANQALIDAHKLLIMQYESVIQFMDDGKDV